MGAIRSSPEKPLVGCCGTRGNAHILCRNDRLNAYLQAMCRNGKVFESAWLYRYEIDVSAEAQYILLYQCNGLLEQQQQADGSSAGGAPARPARGYLRIDWGRDGLSFIEMPSSRLQDNMLVRSKVFEKALDPEELLGMLTEVQAWTFDALSWNSQSFCYHMLEKGKGKVYEYK